MSLGNDWKCSAGWKMLFVVLDRESRAELSAEPLHFGTISFGFFRNDDLNLPGVTENGFEAAKHPVGAAEQVEGGWLMVDGCIGLAQPGRQPDAAGYGIQFGDAEAVVGKQQVGPDDTWYVVLESGRALPLDQFTWFAQIEPARDPLRLLAFGAFPIKQIDRAIKLQQHAAERFDFLRQLGAQRKGGRGDAPFMAGKEPVGRQTIANQAPDFGGGHGSWGFDVDWHGGNGNLDNPGRQKEPRS